MKEYDCVIVGAGLYGVTVANLLKNKYNKKVLVIDKRNHIAGNIYDKKMNGINVHMYGPHIFHTSNKAVWEYVTEFGEFINYVNSPIANYKGEIYSLPFNMYTFNKMWGVVTPEEAIDKISSQKGYANGILNPSNLEEKAIYLVGEEIYNKLIKGYTEKQWGRKCIDLPPDIITRLPVRFTYDNNYYRNKYQGIPKHGYTKLVERMLEGIDVILNVNYMDEKEYFDKIAKKVLYTGAVDSYFYYEHGKLDYRSLKFIIEKHNDINNYQGNAVVNYTDSETKFTRITEHKHLNPIDKRNIIGTVITKEYSYEASSSEDDNICYSVNNGINNNLYNIYKELMDKEANVYFGGRLAEYKYYNMDEVIYNAFEMAKRISL